MRPVYCTREQVKTALDSVETARNNRKIDRAIRAGAESVERLTLRKFAPVLATRTLDWLPELDTSMTWRLWLEENELAGPPTMVVSGGQTLDIATVLPRPDTGPPFDHLELDRASSSSWASGSTQQRAISITGPFASCPIDDVPAATLAADINSSVAACTITASWEIGVGSLVLCGTERMWVTGRSMVSTGQTLQVPMSADQSSTIARVSNGAAFVEDEVILLGAEKMRVDEIAGNDLVVNRKWDGSVLAAHNGETVYAARTLQVERGALGTTPAAHSSADPVLVFRPPALINQYNIAYPECAFLDESSGYARTVGSGDNQREAAGARLAVLEKKVLKAYYRVRTGTAS